MILVLLASYAVASTGFDRAFGELCSGPDALPLKSEGGRSYVEVVLASDRPAVRFAVDTAGNSPGVRLDRDRAERLGLDEADLPDVLSIGGREVPLPEGAVWQLLDDRQRLGWRLSKDWLPGELGAGFLSRYDLVCVDPVGGTLGLGTLGPEETSPARVRGIRPVDLHIETRSRGARYAFTWLVAGGTGWGVVVQSGRPASTLERHAIDRLLAWDGYLPLSNSAWGRTDMAGGAWPERVLGVPEVHIGEPPASGPMPVCPSCPAVEDDEPWLLRRGKKVPGLPIDDVRFVERLDDSLQQRIGKVRFQHWLAGSLGADVLSRFRWVIDYRRGRLWLDPIDPPPPADDPVRVGLALSFGEDGCPIVRQSLDPSVEPGDVVMSVDRRHACTAFHHQVHEWLRTATELRVRRDGQSVHLAVQPRDVMERPLR